MTIEILKSGEFETQHRKVWELWVVTRRFEDGAVGFLMMANESGVMEPDFCRIREEAQSAGSH